MSVNGPEGKFEIKFGNEAALDVEDSYDNIIFLFYNDNLVMIYHPKRKGWEFPSGRRKKNETSLKCVIREAFEEAGCILDTTIPLGYYVFTKDDINLKTSIYMGNVSRFEPRPEWCDIDLVKLFDKLPENISHNSQVYEIILRYINIEYKSTKNI